MGNILRAKIQQKIVQKIQYRDDPKTIQTLKKRQQEFKKLDEKFQNLKGQHDKLLAKLAHEYHKKLEQVENKDPKQFEQAEKKLFHQFLDGLKTFQIKKTVPKNDSFLYYAVVGEIAAGKTTIYNEILGTSEETGVDDTTQYIAKVYQDNQKDIIYWDSPGLGQHIPVTSAQCLKAFYCIDCMFIVTAVSFKSSIRTIQIMDTINPGRLYLVRNQCDKFKKDTEFQKAAGKDKQLLEQYNIKNVIKILYVSMIEDDSFRDNKEFKTLMTTKI